MSYPSGYTYLVTRADVIAHYSTLYWSELSRRVHITHPLDPNPIDVAEMRAIEKQLGMTRKAILVESYTQVFGPGATVDVGGT